MIWSKDTFAWDKIHPENMLLSFSFLRKKPRAWLDSIAVSLFVKIIIGMRNANDNQRKHGPRHFPWKDRHPWQAAVGPMGKPILGMGNGDLANAGQSWPKNLQNHNCICWARLIKSLFLWPKSILRPSFRLTGNHDYCTSAFAGGQAPPATRCLIAIRSTAKSAPSSASVTTLIIIGRF